MQVKPFCTNFDIYYRNIIDVINETLMIMIVSDWLMIFYSIYGNAKYGIQSRKLYI